MPDIVTTQVFVDGEKGITATKMNNIVANSTIQTDFIANKPSSATLDPTDQLLELKAGGTYARITGTQLANSVAAQYALATTSQAGMLHQTSGNIGDYCGGDNLFHPLNTFVSLTAATTLTSADINKLQICTGGSWVLTLPTAANGLAYRVRNDMGISGTVGTITVTPPAGTIDGAATLALLPQQECTILCDGTNWRTFELKREVVLGTQDITTSTASGTVLLPVGFRMFELEWAGLKSVTDAQNLLAQFSTNGGSTWITTATYLWELIYNTAAATVAATSGGGATSILVGPTMNATTAYGHSRMRLFPGSASLVPNCIIDAGDYLNSASCPQRMSIYGSMSAAGPVNALKYFAASGNIASSMLTVKGIV